jgi:hypothetical protein
MKQKRQQNKNTAQKRTRPRMSCSQLAFVIFAILIIVSFVLSSIL